MSKHVTDHDVQPSFYEYAHAQGMTRPQRAKLIRQALRKELRAWLSCSRKKVSQGVFGSVRRSKQSARKHMKRVVYRLVGSTSSSHPHPAR